ncbi:TPA: prophage tail fiber N-terminal domain-containing protein [Salmonella enterica subsp. enterica serovar Wedding]|nr:prophage tail fiber N-terminal domain-containing protein [Salmonella enterica subsp. enterica serovar Wedding]HBM0102795.1 prophage tail fiber N-terminal domain-containing protein [Salmonella enterica subsp. enterica serovar Wedding]
MPIISGTLTDGAGQPVADCTIQLKALNTTSAVIVTTTASVGTDAGKYRIEAQPGRYAVTLVISGFPPSMVGHIEVRPDSPDAALNDYLRDIKSEDLTSEAMKQFQELASQARESADKALVSETAASGSATAARVSQQEAKSSEDNAAARAAEALKSQTAAGASEVNAGASEKNAAVSAAAALASQKAAKLSEDNAATSESASSNKAASATKDAQRAETARAAAEAAAASVDVHEAPADGICYVRQNGAWVRQGAFDVGVSVSTGEVNSTSHQLFTLDGTRDNTVTFSGLSAGRAAVLALVFKGQGGTITWPDNLTWSQNEIPKLAATRTVVSILWDGETLTGTTALTV